MIQRIQTVYLSLATFLTICVAFTPIYNRIMDEPQTWIGICFVAALLLSMIINVFSIGLYNDREKQLKRIKIARVFQLVGLAVATAVLFTLDGFGLYLWAEILGTILILLGFILQMLAVRAIKKDEELVRSIDRIR